MDKKNTILGIIFICAALFVMMRGVNQQQTQSDARQYAQTVAEKSREPIASESHKTPFYTDVKFDEKQNIIELSNDYIKVVLTNLGASISTVDLLKYKEEQGATAPYSFNNPSFALSMAFGINPNGNDFVPLFLQNFKLKSSSKNSAEFVCDTEKYTVTRKYSLVTNDKIAASPYLIDVETSIKNKSENLITNGSVFLSLGMAAPTAGDVYGNNLSLALYNGSSDKFIHSTIFADGSGFLGFGKTKAKKFEILDMQGVQWGAVKNQFFAAVFTPNRAADGGIAFPCLINPEAQNKYMSNGLVGFMRFDLQNIAPNAEWVLKGSYYVGPKELIALTSLGKDQDLVMNFGWFGFVSRPLLSLLNIIHSLIDGIAPSWGWGWSIVILTVFVKLCLWPLTSMQIKSSKRMAKLQGPLKEIKEKFKNDPQKVSQETMKLYQEYGINPLAGCFPLIIQLPIFIGLYYMLQTSCEIRFAHFLWIRDLSLPDEIPGFATIFGYPLHVLPLINALLTYIQMHMTPNPSGDKAQKFMFKLMPFIMLIFFYTFPSGLVLYWTVQSLIGIVQTIIVNRTKDDIVLEKKIRKPGFMQKLSKAMEEAQKQNAQIKKEKLKGTMMEERKKNPGGRSTPSKNR